MIVDSDGENSHLAGKQKQILISYVKLNIMMALTYFTKKREAKVAWRKTLL